MFKVKLSAILLFMVFCTVARAQTGADITADIIKHFEYYKAKKANTMLFVHLDKTVYVNNEMMWFTGYLLGATKKVMPRHSVFATVLVNDNDQTIAAQGKFVMGGGLAYGNMMIPDTIPPGHYSFVAYTNYIINGKPEAYFVQPVTLKTVTQPPFNVELLLDTSYKDPANVRVLLKADSRNAPLDGATINYYLGKDPHTRLSGKAKTNVIGSYTLLLPKDHITTAQHNLEVQVKFGADIKTLHLNIPIKKQITDVKFYPEGGSMVAGLPNRVGWEVKTPGGTAIKTTGVLYAGNSVLDTIETDSFGMGSFNIIPLPNMAYSVKLLQDNSADEVYNLPATINEGLVMHLANVLVEDTLKFTLQNNVPGNITVLVHNYNKLYLTSTLNVTPQGQSVKVDISTLPRGLNTITLLDSLQRPCAERLFFAHYNQKPSLSIAMDTREPGTRQKVTIKLKLKSAYGKRVQGVVSVACVQDNRFEIKNDNNIEHYAYLQSEIDNLPLKDTLMGNNKLDRQYLNEFFLVRGWSKYKWPELMQSAPADTFKKQDSLMFTGTITHYTDALKKPVQVIMMKDSSGINMLNSTAKGDFTLTNNNVYTPANKKVRLIVSGGSDEYIIKVNDPYPPFNKILAQNIEPVLYEEPLIKNTSALVLKGSQHATNLKEVKIKARTDNFTHGFGGVGANACGDYICMNSILNCPNHRADSRNRPPMQGEMVHVPGQGLVAYSGCSDGGLQAGMMAFTGVYAAREFYGADYTKINPIEADYLSTICWKHAVRVNSNTDADISFYTSDITGKFRIVVQGITNEDVVYGESDFTVQKKVP